MSMFSKLKEVNEFRQQAKKIQNELSTLIVDKTRGSASVRVSGNMEIIDLIIGDGTSQDDVKQLINDALKEAQQVAAQHMRATGALNLPGM